MVIEHSFVTTMDGPQAMRAAEAFLGERGFATAHAPAFPVGDATAESLEMRRGKNNPSRAKSVSELPQAIRVDFDRGRVTVAASITPSHAWGASKWQWTSVGAIKERPERMALHQGLLLGIVNGLEQLLVNREPPDRAAMAWHGVETHIAAAARKRKRRNLITLAIFITVVTALMVLLIVAANS